MDASSISELVTGLGFPIACVIMLGWFIQKLVGKQSDREERLLAKQDEREEKLYEIIKETSASNSKFIETLDNINNSLKSINDELKDVKADVSELKIKTEIQK